MPTIGIVRGFGEGYIATGYIIKLIKALNQRFRSKIIIKEIPAGDYIKYGYTLSEEAFSAMKECDCIYIGDMYSRANPLDYTYQDIAASLSNNIEYTHICGINNNASIKIELASYFDGGFHLREGEHTINGCTETRVCSTYCIMNIVKNITHRCEKGRRRLCFVKDGDNEYCANEFMRNFESFTSPLSNFQFLTYTIRDIVREMLFAPGQFGTVFASCTFAETALGIYASLLGDDFTFYNKYESEKSTYALRSSKVNSYDENYVSTLCSYIAALGDMLSDDLGLNKESSQLFLAMENAMNRGVSYKESSAFINTIIEELQAPVKKYSKKQPESRYIIK